MKKKPQASEIAMPQFQKVVEPFLPARVGDLIYLMLHRTKLLILQPNMGADIIRLMTGIKLCYDHGRMGNPD